MERVKDYLKMLGNDIIDEIHENGDPEDMEALEQIEDMCDAYNDIYKFFCHHKCLLEGHDPRHAEHYDVAPHVAPYHESPVPMR